MLSCHGYKMKETLVGKIFVYRDENIFFNLIYKAISTLTIQEFKVPESVLGIEVTHCDCIFVLENGQ